MKGWLVYDRLGAKRNEWFIDRLISLFRERGTLLELKTDDEITENGELPAFAIVRAIRPALNAALEERGVRVFNNAQTSRTANDKWETYLACKEWGIPVLPTERAADKTALGYPCIVKTTDGHGGAEVFRAENEGEYRAISECLRLGNRPAIAQAQNAVLGRDMRVYALGGEIVAGVLRSSDADFRSNFSLGGRVEPRAADGEQKRIVEKLYEKLRFDFVGIDFLPNGRGGWILNEIEDAAGARMLYRCTDIDIAALFADYVCKQMRGREI